MVSVMHDLVFLFDVDNTLLDNDRVQADLRAYLAENFGRNACDRYWKLFEEMRATIGYADYLGALQRYRLEALHNPRVLRMANWFIEYPFADRLFPSALQIDCRVESLLPFGGLALLPSERLKRQLLIDRYYPVHVVLDVGQSLIVFKFDPPTITIVSSDTLIPAAKAGVRREHRAFNIRI